MKKALVAYFSASGVTKALAERLAESVGADLFEISPKTPYTDADLNWMDAGSRSTVEMKDRSCRPPMRDHLKNIADYEVIFVGFPVWWYREPSIIDTFLESCSFAGKTLIPFATSGGSGLGKTAENFRALAPGASVEIGKRFKASASAEELKSWASSLL